MSHATARNPVQSLSGGSTPPQSPSAPPTRVPRATPSPSVALRRPIVTPTALSPSPSPASRTATSEARARTAAPTDSLIEPHSRPQKKRRTARTEPGGAAR
eukprot:6078480-Prymnesium_polylepis.1